MSSGRLAPMVREVRRLAAERPDFVYDDQPERIGATRPYHHGADGEGNGAGCIIGEAAKALGASRATLRRMDDGRTLREALSLALRRPIAASVTRGEQEAIWWLGSVQVSQDMGESWGSAVEKADFTMGEAVSE